MQVILGVEFSKLKQVHCILASRKMFPVCPQKSVTSRNPTENTKMARSRCMSC